MCTPIRTGRDASAQGNQRAAEGSTWGGVSLKHWSSTQTSIALPSGGAEFVALAKAATEGMAVQALAAELGWTLNLVVHVDAATAKATAS